MHLEIPTNLCVVCGAATCEAFSFHDIIQRCVITVALADLCKRDGVGGGHVLPPRVHAAPPTTRELGGILIEPWLISRINTEIEAPAFPPASQCDGKQAATPRRAPRKLGVLPRLVTVIHLKLLSPRRVVASVQQRSGIRHQTVCRSRRLPICRRQERLSQLILCAATGVCLVDLLCCCCFFFSGVLYCNTVVLLRCEMIRYASIVLMGNFHSR